jgi:hypothetical protein
MKRNDLGIRTLFKTELLVCIREKNNSLTVWSVELEDCI